MKRLLVIALLMCFFHLQAQTTIGLEEARATAERFVLQQGKQVQQTLTLSEEIKSTETGQTNLFVFAIEPKGYVIVSAMNEVLAYSFTSSMPPSDELPDHIAYWIGLYNEQTDYILQHPDRIKKPERQQHSVGPLLTSIWGQGCYYNEACPEDENGSCQHVSAGCVAIAMAQIMYYHKMPKKGKGSISYNCAPYGTLSANFGQTIYPWDDMADSLNCSNPAVALLVSHCGIGVKTNYGPHSSTAFGALNAFQQYFSYPTALRSQRSDFDEEIWLAMLKNNLDLQHPVYYAGQSQQGGHAFVCDGYDTLGMFHFNFGWNGVADGYYTLSNPNGFTTYQYIIHNLVPMNDFSIQCDSHGIVYVAPDGMGDGSSWENATNQLQAAIYQYPTSEHSIWVKEGTYYGEPFELFSFTLLGNCQVYGGFKGDEPFDFDLSQRDFEAHPSILDGNHSQGVVYSVPHSTTRATILDGFTIRNGNSPYGGGIFIQNKAFVSNCKICYNKTQYNGGGLAQVPNDVSDSLIVKNCEFFGNEAKNGGAIYEKGKASFIRCNIHDNTAQNGGGIHSASRGQSQFINCTIKNNSAQNGGGTYSLSKVSFWNCLIANNTANTGGGCLIRGGANLYNCTIVKNKGLTDYGGVSFTQALQNEIKHCIIWGNTSPDGNTQIGPLQIHTYCAVQNDMSGSTLNFNAEAENDSDSSGFYIRFKDSNVQAGCEAHGGDWHLQSGSLCIDRVRPISSQPATDLDGKPRMRHNNVDLGAYESDAVAFILNRPYCEETPYYYNGTLIPLPGTYSFLYEGAAYDSLVILQLFEETVFMEEEICEGETYSFFGETLCESGHYSTYHDCKTYELDLTVKQMPVIDMEEEICEGETFYFFGETLCEAGHYSAIKDCKRYELELIVPPNPTITLEETICQGESYYFYGTYLRESGHYTKSHNCKTYELDLTVNPAPPLRCSNDTLIIYGNQVELTASGADAYLWSTEETTASITVAPKKDKTYSVKGFSHVNGCYKTVSVTVKVKNLEDEVVMFPNPASDMVEINISFIDEVEVFNLLGERICHIKANREAVKLDVSDYPAGIYIVQVKQLKNLYFVKLVVGH